MPTRSELGELIGKIQNSIEVYKEDVENSEFADDGFVIPKLEKAVWLFQSYLPALTAVEDLLFGDTTPNVFMKRWKRVEKANVDYSVDTITPEVADFLNRISGKPDDDEGDTA